MVGHRESGPGEVREGAVGGILKELRVCGGPLCKERWPRSRATARSRQPGKMWGTNTLTSLLPPPVHYCEAWGKGSPLMLFIKVQFWGREEKDGG